MPRKPDYSRLEWINYPVPKTAEEIVEKCVDLLNAEDDVVRERDSNEDIVEGWKSYKEYNRKKYRAFAERGYLLEQLVHKTDQRYVNTENGYATIKPEEKLRIVDHKEFLIAVAESGRFDIFTGIRQTVLEELFEEGVITDGVAMLKETKAVVNRRNLRRQEQDEDQIEDDDTPHYDF